MGATEASAVLDLAAVRADFPVLAREVRPGVPLIYLDSAATSQKPKSVIEALVRHFQVHNANIHRGIHQLAEESTEAYESARARVAAFVGVADPRQIVFTRNATESINLVAHSWGRSQLQAGDRVLLTEMEHHSNLVPWYQLADERGLELLFAPITDSGELDLPAFKDLLDAHSPRLAAFSHMSNVLGTINPVAQLVEWSRAAGAVTVIDGAQSVPHLPVNLDELQPDFYAFSGHKMLGPTGIGVLFGRMELLESMPPFLGGGEMIKRVGFGTFAANDVPHKFEAGTPAIAEAIGLGAAVDYLGQLGMHAVQAHEAAMIEYAMERLEEVPGVQVYGPPADKRGGVAAFTFEGAHPHDVAQLLDRHGIAVRAGHHCAMPLHEKLDLPATTRASFYVYNTTDEVDQLIEALYDVKSLFAD